MRGGMLVRVASRRLRQAFLTLPIAIMPAAFGAQVRVLTKLNEQAGLDFEEPPVPCAVFEDLLGKCFGFYNKCVEAGGTPAAECLVPYDCE